MTVFRRKAMRLSELARDNEAQRTLVGIGTQIVHKPITPPSKVNVKILDNEVSTKKVFKRGVHK